jgi:hypothetical protein
LAEKQEKPKEIQMAFNQSSKSIDRYPHYDCQCDFSTLLHIHDCPDHPRGPTATNPPTAAFVKELKMPNLLKQPEDCIIVRQGWVKKKTTNIFLGFQERYLILYSNKKLVYYKLLKAKQSDPTYRNHW